MTDAEESRDPDAVIRTARQFADAVGTILGQLRDAMAEDHQADIEALARVRQSLRYVAGQIVVLDREFEGWMYDAMPKAKIMLEHFGPIERTRPSEWSAHDQAGLIDAFVATIHVDKKLPPDQAVREGVKQLLEVLSSPKFKTRELTSRGVAIGQFMERKEGKKSVRVPDLEDE